MRENIDGHSYDTDNATKVHTSGWVDTNEDGNCMNDTLYRTESGQYFIHMEWHDEDGDGEQIEPYSPGDVLGWLEGNSVEGIPLGCPELTTARKS